MTAENSDKKKRTTERGSSLLLRIHTDIKRLKKDRLMMIVSISKTDVTEHSPVHPEPQTANSGPSSKTAQWGCPSFLRTPQEPLWRTIPSKTMTGGLKRIPRELHFTWVPEHSGKYRRGQEKDQNSAETSYPGWVLFRPRPAYDSCARNLAERWKILGLTLVGPAVSRPGGSATKEDLKMQVTSKSAKHD
jgi:hypothetical protein